MNIVEWVGRRAWRVGLRSLVALAVVLALGAVATRGWAEPAPPVSHWIAATGASPAQVGLVAVPVTGGAPLLEWNAARALNPASTIKLLSTYVALNVLGPEYRWVTTAHLRGRLSEGVLEGDLVLRGGGDPKLVVEDLTEFIRRMRAAGLREIRGD
ncbi:MAG: D-alanyl-D-alanine carboxypeptidase, partial [Betaproteobacteria bacterium]|nr:D-alanyl-D-alanine carboxypeptidase [Betaproteobacteria bacterium]